MLYVDKTANKIARAHQLGLWKRFRCARFWKITTLGEAAACCSMYKCPR
jgi:hypothetical protein